MKKALLVLAAIAMSGSLLTSCSSSHSCPDYGKVAKTTTEQPC